MQKIKLKLSQIEQSMAPFNRLLKLRLRPRLAFRIGKFLRKLMPIGEEINKRRLDIFKTYGEEGEAKGTFKMSPQSENIKDFERDIKELFSEEVEIEIPEILVDDIENKEVEISPSDIMILDWLIKEKTKENA